MSKQEKAKAQWNKMTEQQKRYWLGYYIMGWKLRNYDDDLIITEKSAGKGYSIEEALNNDGYTWDGRDCNEEAYHWNPLTDWNHTMEVVEKMSEKSYSFDYKIRGFRGGRHAHFGDWDDSIYMETGQEAACRAAFITLQS